MHILVQTQVCQAGAETARSALILAQAQGCHTKAHHDLSFLRAESLGSTTILGITVIPDPLPANSVSITLPGTNLNTGTQYLNLTVACWPANFSRLVSRFPRHPRGRWAEVGHGKPVAVSWQDPT